MMSRDHTTQDGLVIPGNRQLTPYKKCAALRGGSMAASS